MTRSRETKKTHRALIQFHVTPTQAKRLRARAKRDGVSRAELMRQALRGIL